MFQITQLGDVAQSSRRLGPRSQCRERVLCISETGTTGRRWSARRTGTPETPETGVVVLITQRSQVQILPPLPFSQVRGLFRLRERPSCYGVLTSLLTAPSAK